MSKKLYCDDCGKELIDGYVQAGNNLFCADCASQYNLNTVIEAVDEMIGNNE